MKKALTFFLLLLIIFPLGRVISQYWGYYLSPLKPNEAKNAYEISQYVREENVSWIPDELHFLYASQYYLNGGSPILVNPDYPPLGKYLVAFSIALFNNEKIPTLFFVSLSLLSFFLLAKTFLKESWLALIPVVLLAWERLFQEQLMYLPLFEVFMLAFFNLTLYFFIKGEKKSDYFFVSSLFLGMLWATKPWMITLPLMGAMAASLVLKRQFKKWLYWLISLPLAIMVLVISYSRLMVEGWSLYKILSVQKWILWYHGSKLVNVGSVWPFIYLKRWYIWWGDKPFISVDQWNILWPIFTSLALIISVLVLTKSLGLKRKWIKKFKHDERIVVLSLWVVFEILFLSTGNVNVRNIFSFLPICYLLGVYSLIVLWRTKFLTKVLDNVTRKFR